MNSVEPDEVALDELPHLELCCLQNLLFPMDNCLLLT